MIFLKVYPNDASDTKLKVEIKSEKGQISVYSSQSVPYPNVEKY